MEDIDPRWRASSYSGNGGECVEVGGRSAGNRILVRDTKDRTGPTLRFTPAAWRRFADRLKPDASLPPAGPQWGGNLVRESLPFVVLGLVSWTPALAVPGTVNGWSGPSPLVRRLMTFRTCRRAAQQSAVDRFVDRITRKCGCNEGNRGMITRHPCRQSVCSVVAGYF
jgi:hypothetical protein